MKTITKMKTKIKDFYNAINSVTNEWKELVQSYFEYRVTKKADLQKAEKELEEKYLRDETIAALLEGVEERDISAFKAVLTNTYEFIKQYEEARPTTNGTLDVSMILLIVRRTLRDLTIRHLIGFQPMQGPVGLQYKLRYKDEEVEEDKESNTTLEGTPRKRLSLQIDSNVIEAATKRLSAAWAIEAMEDMNKMLGLDVEMELIQALAQEIATEINQEWLRNIEHIATKETETITDVEHLIYVINRQCSGIAHRTRRGAGNWVVMSPSMLIKFKNAVEGKGIYEEADEDSPAGCGLQYVGTLNDTIKIYVNIYADDNKLLIGYKGETQPDAGLFYAPYQLVMPSGIVINPKTFEPICGFMTRNGYHSDDKTPDYYRTVKIEGLENWPVKDKKND